MVFASSRSRLSLVRLLFILLAVYLKLYKEDELVSLDDLQEKIAEFEDYVQSSDVAAMQSKRCRLSLR